jgi:TrmH family RNA methyltransferase
VPETLISENNPLLKEVRRAAHQGGLTSPGGLALAEGSHLLQEALRSRAEVRAVIASESSRVELRAFDGARLLRVSDATFARLTTTETPQGVLALVRPPSWTLADLLRQPSLVFILDGIQDPGNAGAILRAADAFGATGAVFLKGSVNPYNPKCLRGSAGSVFRLPLIAGVAVEDLAEVGPLYSADPRAVQVVSSANLAASCGIVIGSEGRGVSPALAARSTGVRIPTEHVESLNAAVAAGILLYEARRQRTTAQTAE